MTSFTRFISSALVVAPIALSALTGCSSENKTTSPATGGAITVTSPAGACTIAKSSTNQFSVKEEFTNGTETNLSNSTLTFKSEDPNTISVDSGGNFLGVSVGQTTITIKAADGASVSLTCTCT